MAETKPAPGKSRAIARILVSTSTAEGSEALIDIASTLAHALRASLKGIFVREQAIQDLAGLPFATIAIDQRLSRFQINRQAIEQAWLREETLYRRALSRRAEKERLDWSFESITGSIESCLTGAATPGDLIAIATGAAGPATPGLIAQLAHLAGIARAVLMIGPRSSHLTDGPIVVINQKGQADDHILGLAGELAESLGHPLAIVSMEPDQNLEEALSLAGRPGTRLEVSDFLSLARAPLQQLSASLRALRPALVIADLVGLIEQGEPTARALLRATGAPVLLAGRPPSGRGEPSTTR